jgi:hypothetical protein
MSLPVSLEEVVGHLDILANEVAVFVNRRTGEVVSVFLPDLEIIEEGQEDLRASRRSFKTPYTVRERFAGSGTPCIATASKTRGTTSENNSSAASPPRP